MIARLPKRQCHGRCSGSGFTDTPSCPKTCIFLTRMHGALLGSGFLQPTLSTWQDVVSGDITAAIKLPFRARCYFTDFDISRCGAAGLWPCWTVDGE